jgi:hypothetical protein
VAPPLDFGFLPENPQNQHFLTKMTIFDQKSPFSTILNDFTEENGQKRGQKRGQKVPLLSHPRGTPWM